MERKISQVGFWKPGLKWVDIHRAWSEKEKRKWKWEQGEMDGARECFSCKRTGTSKLWGCGEMQSSGDFDKGCCGQCCLRAASQDKYCSQHAPWNVTHPRTDPLSHHCNGATLVIALLSLCIKYPSFFFFLLPCNSLLEAVLIANSTLIQGTSSPQVLQKHFLNYFNYNTYYILVYYIWGCTCLLNTPWLDQVCISSILACALHVLYDQDMVYWIESIKIWPGPNQYKHLNLCCTLVLIHTSTHTQWLKYFFN